MSFPSGTKSDDEEDEDKSFGNRANDDLLSKAKWLRKQTAKCRCDPDSVKEIYSCLSELSPAHAEFVIRDGNRNGKGALHFASQIRGGDADAPELIRFLVSLRADINASIKRGHTALIFASSRGHSVVAELLLDLGANPLVITVCGESAAKVGRGRLSPKVQARLDDAEAAASSATWHDFRDVPDAQDAENVWMTNAAKRKLRLSKVAQEQLEKDAAQQHLASELSVSLEQAVDAANSETVLRLLLTSMSDGSFTRETIICSLRMVLGRFLGNTCKQNFLSLLIMFRERELEHVLHSMGQKDRRPICAILHALIHEIRTQDNAKCISDASFLEILDTADLFLAVEVFMTTTITSAADMSSIERLFGELTEALGNACCASEVLNISSYLLLEKHSNIFSSGLSDLALGISKVGKKQVAEWLCFLRFADHVRLGTPDWRKIVHAVAVAAVAKKLSNTLLRVTTIAAIGLSSELTQILFASLSDVGSESAKIAIICKPSFDDKVIAKYPLYELTVPPTWVEEEEQVLQLHKNLEDMAKSFAISGQPLLVGVDTEWGCDSSSPSESIIAVMQIAVEKRVWVVDCLRRNAALGSLVDWLCDSESIKIIGFAFSHDSDKLKELTRVDRCGAKNIGNKVVDLQELAMRHLPLGHMPGLKAVSEIWLGKTLDKAYQCSDWRRRPLMDAQVTYAAADAAVLLDLALAMGIEPGIGKIGGG